MLSSLFSFIPIPATQCPAFLSSSRTMPVCLLSCVTSRHVLVFELFFFSSCVIFLFQVCFIQCSRHFLYCHVLFSFHFLSCHFCIIFFFDSYCDMTVFVECLFGLCSFSFYVPSLLILFPIVSFLYRCISYFHIILCFILCYFLPYRSLLLSCSVLRLREFAFRVGVLLSLLPIPSRIICFLFILHSPLFNRVFLSHLFPSFVVFLFSVLCEIAASCAFHI